MDWCFSNHTLSLILYRGNIILLERDNQLFWLKKISKEKLRYYLSKDNWNTSVLFSALIKDVPWRHVLDMLREIWKDMKWVIYQIQISEEAGCCLRQLKSDFLQCISFSPPLFTCVFLIFLSNDGRYSVTIPFLVVKIQVFKPFILVNETTKLQSIDGINHHTMTVGTVLTPRRRGSFFALWIIGGLLYLCKARSPCVGTC